MFKRSAPFYINLNLYHYAGNNPIRYSDPTGMATERPGAMALRMTRIPRWTASTAEPPPVGEIVNIVIEAYLIADLINSMLPENAFSMSEADVEDRDDNAEVPDQAKEVLDHVKEL